MRWRQKIKNRKLRKWEQKISNKEIRNRKLKIKKIKKPNENTRNMYEKETMRKCVKKWNQEGELGS